jgi:hypothetical protein
MSRIPPSSGQLSSASPPKWTDVVELSGHIIDSLILPKVLDEITSLGGEYESRDIRIGHNRHDPSYVRLEVSAPTPDTLEKILTAIGQHGAMPIHQVDCKLVPADIAGTFPKAFTPPPTNRLKSASPPSGIPSNGSKWIAA